MNLLAHLTSLPLKKFYIISTWQNKPTIQSFFKKLQNEIWEFRTRFAGLQIRLLAFWDKTDNRKTLVIATHGFIKKVDKIPSKEIEKATRLRSRYFNK